MSFANICSKTIWKQFFNMIAQIHIRVLLDMAREKIFKASGNISWEDFRDSYGGIDDLKKMIISSHGVSASMATFICEYTNVRQDGSNEAAHAARHSDIRSAVLQELDGTERRSLENLYQFVFDKDINSSPLIAIE